MFMSNEAFLRAEAQRREEAHQKLTSEQASLEQVEADRRNDQRAKAASFLAVEAQRRAEAAAGLKAQQAAVAQREQQK
jgi:hypothetical protein